MALVASSHSGAAYSLNTNDDRDSAGGFEFTRRKRWPQLLLQELVGAALFCVKPVAVSGDQNGGGPSTSWKIIYCSPSVTEMIGRPSAELEGQDFLDIVFAPDHPQLEHLFASLLQPAPPLPHADSNSSSTTSSSSVSPFPATQTAHTASTRSQTVYVRMLAGELLAQEKKPKKSSFPDADGASGSGSGRQNGNGHVNGAHMPKNPIVWEIRAHATSAEASSTLGQPQGTFGMGRQGTVNPKGGDDSLKGKAVWVMGRRVGEPGAEGDNGQSLDAFLELKLENERLREELRDLQMELDSDDELLTRSSYDPSASMARPAPMYHPDDLDSDVSDSEASDSSRDVSPGAGDPLRKLQAGAAHAHAHAHNHARLGRPPKDSAARDKKRSKKAGLAVQAAMVKSGGLGAGPGAGEGEGMHVCVTCGRTDSPEWRKGPLGPKTLCNACGLRWAKRNSNQPSRKEKKAIADAKKG